MRRRFRVVHQWPQYAAQMLAAPAREVGVQIMPVLRNGTLEGGTAAMAAQIFGGFLTCNSWVLDALEKKERPDGVYFSGIRHKVLLVHVSEKTKASCPMFFAMLCVLQSDKALRISIIESLQEAYDAFTAYSKKMVQSRNHGVQYVQLLLTRWKNRQCRSPGKVSKTTLGC